MINLIIAVVLENFSMSKKRGGYEVSVGGGLNCWVGGCYVL